MLGKRIFVVEDEGIVAADLEDRLKSLGYPVAGVAASGEEALSLITATTPDLVLMDIVLRGAMNGIETADRVRQELDIPVVFLTSHADTSTLRRACRTEPMGYVLKPFEERELQVTIELALHRHEADRKVRHMQRWLATTLKSIGDGIVATDTEGRVTFLNPVAEQLTGWTSGDAQGRDFSEVFQARHAVTGETIPNPVFQALQQGEVVTIAPQTQLHRRDGQVVPIDDSAAPIRDDQGGMTGAVLVFRDCSERFKAEAEIRRLNEHLEQRVQLRTAQLTAANQELESFSYSVSHDLRAPLRAINGFSSILLARCQDQLDEEGKRLLGNVCEAASRMGQMVDDFLSLARVGRQPVRSIPVNMEQLVAEVVTSLNLDTRQPKPSVSVGSLPAIPGDPALLRHVWTNLINNAVKFSHQRELPSIEIQGRLEGSEAIYSVRDNGVGFSMEFAQKLFGTFQRLHSDQAFEGTGVGLAIVQRIVQRHGGRVWAQALPDQGATFFFALPLQSNTASRAL